MTTILDDVTPSDIGLPNRYADFRAIQREMCDYTLYGPSPDSATRRVTACGAPTGSGKELAAQAMGTLSGMKFAVLTATRTLEDQAAAGGYSDLVNIRGKANYECRHKDVDYPNDIWNCDEGEDHDCPFKGKVMCAYGERVEAAKGARSVLSNYQYWLNARSRNRQALESNRADGKIGMLILDEAHKAPGELARFLGAYISNANLHQYAGEGEVKEVLHRTKGAEWGKITQTWLGLLETAQLRLTIKLSEIADQYNTAAEAARFDPKYKKLAELAGDLERIVSLGGDNNWLWRHTKNGIAFDCVWPGRYTEKYLFSGVERVVLISATLRPKLMAMLGIKGTDYHFKEWPRVFPASESPVYWLPTGKMGHKVSESEKLQSVRQLDNIFEEWGHLKGIVHTNSYNRAQWVARNSRYSRHMIVSESGDALRAAEEYKRRKPPVMLVSPSHTTGWDFPEEEMSWSVINKLPFPDRSDPVTQARVESDPDWYDYETMQTLQQACGRQKRRPGQRSITFITDDAVRNFRNYARRHASKWFKIMDAPGGAVPRGWGKD